MGQRRLFPKTRSAVKADGTSIAGTTQAKGESFGFYRQRMELKQIHKRLRAGLVVWENISSEMRELLIRYYGYNEDGVQL